MMAAECKPAGEPVSTPPALIKFSGVDLGYSGRPVLRSVGLTVAKGDFLGIVGPNGAGKTTLLRGILGTLRPLCGSVSFADGRGVLRFGYVPQRQSLDDAFPLSVLDVVLMGRNRLVGLCRRPRKADRESAVRALAQVGLSHLAGSLYRDLSGGQKQRVLIARALAGEPNVLVLDEPTTDLDLAGQRAVMDLLARLHEENGLTVVVVSHLLHHVINYATSIAFVVDDTVSVMPTETAVTEAHLGRLYGIGVHVGEVEGRRFVL